jgi:hypothetical protein
MGKQGLLLGCSSLQMPPQFTEKSREFKTVWCDCSGTRPGCGEGSASRRARGGGTAKDSQAWEGAVRRGSEVGKRNAGWGVTLREGFSAAARCRTRVAFGFGFCR